MSSAKPVSDTSSATKPSEKRGAKPENKSATKDQPQAEPPRILLVAGEASGDTHGAELISALAKRQPALKFIGVGGPKMAAAGQDQIADMSKHAVVGLVEVLRHYPKLRAIFSRLLTLAKKEQPEVIVLIDYPGFNLRLARALRRALPDHRIVYYISPQVWAWKSGRVTQMARSLDLLLAIFPFEPDFFRNRAPKFPVTWVGHPMLDRLNKPSLGQVEAGRIALMPGSRREEIRRHLPLMWEAAVLMTRQRSDLHFVIISPNDERQRQITEWIETQPAPPFAFDTYCTYQLSHINRCEFALVKSGTSSMDCAFVGVPHAVVYKVNPVTYLAGKYVVKIQYLSMVNVLAEDPPVIPELIQGDFTPEKLSRLTLDLLEKPEKLTDMKKEMAEVVASLGEAGASDRAARAILVELAACPPVHRTAPPKPELLAKPTEAKTEPPKPEAKSIPASTASTSADKSKDVTESKSSATKPVETKGSSASKPESKPEPSKPGGKNIQLASADTKDTPSSKKV